MTPQDIFGIIIRTVGLLMLIMWVFALTGCILAGGDKVLLVYSFGLCTIGGYLLQGSPFVMRFAYSRTAPRGERTSEENAG